MKIGFLKISAVILGLAVGGQPACAAVDLTGDTFHVTQLPYSGASLNDFGNVTDPGNISVGPLGIALGANSIVLTGSNFAFNYHAYIDLTDLTSSLSSIDGISISSIGSTALESATIDTATNSIYLLFSGNYFSANASTTITFSSPAGVPEPASWAMMIAGLGLAGVALRRRQQNVALSYA